MSALPNLASGVQGLRGKARPIPAIGPPEIQEKILESYGGISLRTRVATPADRDELRAVLELAKARQWSVTFRGGGHAFDTQSLNEQLVVSLRKLRRIEIDTESSTVTAEAGAIWGDILAKSVERGMVPYVMVTTHTASVGGTLASNSLSRFSPTLAREGQHVTRFSLMMPDGTILECSRHANPQFFWSAVGGLGYVGAVLDVTHELLPLGIAPRNIAVATTFEKVEGIEKIAEALLSHVREKAHGGGHRSALQALSEARRDPLENSWAVSAVVYMQKSETGLIATSRYTDAAPGKRRRSVFHSPNSIGAWVLQIAALFPPLRDIGYSIVIGHGFQEPESYVDDVDGYTFFEDGNRNLRTVGRALGLPMGIHQHTYIIPFDPSKDLGHHDLGTFLRTAKSKFEENGLSPTLIDVLYLPDDAGDRFFLSSSRDLPGFAVTFTFEKPLSSRFEKEKTVLRELVETCRGLGGRVHLTKNVDATAEQIEAMYGAEIANVRSERKGDLISNEFMQRVLPELGPKPRR